MASSSLDFLHYQQPLSSAVQPAQRHSTVWNCDTSTVSNTHNSFVAVAPNMSPSARLQNCLIEYFNLTAESLDPFGEPAVGEDTKGHFKDPSIGANPTGGQDDSGGPFVSIEEVLCDVEAQEPQNAVSNVEHGSHKVDGPAERPAPIDCDNAAAHRATRSGDTLVETDSPSGSRPSSDGLMSMDQGAQRGLLKILAVPRPGPEIRCPTLYENAKNSISDDPPPSPATAATGASPLAASNPVPWSISLVQTESRNGALKSIGPGSSTEGKENANTDDGHKRDGDWTATGTISIRDSAKRTAGNAELNEGGEGVTRLGKVRRIDSIGAIGNGNEEMSALDFVRIRSLPQPVFRMPPFWRDFRQRENTISSSRSSETGESQENLLVISDYKDKPSENSCSTSVTSVGTKLGPAQPPGDPTPENAETQARLSTGTQPTTEPVDRLIFPSATLPQLPYIRDGGEDDHAVAAVTNRPSASPSPLYQPPPAPARALEEEEWEIRKIVEKRRVGRVYEYKVRWEDTWLARRELGNAEILLKEFEAQDRAQHSCRMGRSARAKTAR